MSLSLNCLLLGDEPDRMFTVEIFSFGITFHSSISYPDTRGSWSYTTSLSQLLSSRWWTQSDVHCRNSEEQKCRHPQKTNQKGEGPSPRPSCCFRSRPVAGLLSRWRSSFQESHNCWTKVESRKVIVRCVSLGAWYQSYPYCCECSRPRCVLLDSGFFMLINLSRCTIS